jgi:hypothetical protein
VSYDALQSWVSNLEWLRILFMVFISILASHFRFGFQVFNGFATIYGVSFKSNIGYLSNRLSGVRISCPSLLGYGFVTGKPFCLR